LITRRGCPKSLYPFFLVKLPCIFWAALTRYAKSRPRWTIRGAKNSLARGVAQSQKLAVLFVSLNHSNRFYQPILKTRSGAGKPAPPATAKNPSCAG